MTTDFLWIFVKILLVFLVYSLNQKFLISKIIKNPVAINELEYREQSNSNKIDENMSDELFYLFLVDIIDFFLLYFLITSVF